MFTVVCYSTSSLVFSPIVAAAKCSLSWSLLAKITAAKTTTDNDNTSKDNARKHSSTSMCVRRMLLTSRPRKLSYFSGQPPPSFCGRGCARPNAAFCGRSCGYCWHCRCVPRRVPPRLHANCHCRAPQNLDRKNGSPASSRRGTMAE